LFEPFRPHLHLKFVKSADMLKEILQKSNLGIKNAELYADFEYVKKVAKNSRENGTR
jgi:hypothetical protein